jgi:hypothetical protein
LRGEQEDRLLLHPPGDEGKGVLARAVEPVGVVDQHQEPRLGRRLADQLVGREGDVEAVGLEVVALPEGGFERPPARVRQPLGVVEHGGQQLVQPGEGEFDLRLDPDRGEHPRAALLGGLPRPGQQRRLADPRIAEDDQRATALAQRREGGVEPGDLVVAADQGARQSAPPVISLLPFSVRIRSQGSRFDHRIGILK